VRGLVSRLCGIRNVIWSIHNANLEPGKNRSTTLIIVRICAMLSRWIPTRIVSCSQAATVLHQQAGYCVNKFMTIPNGYAVDSFAPDRQAGLAVRRSLALPENRPVLGMVARFHPLKDHSNFVQALGLLKQKNITFSCLLVGTGMLEDNKILVALIEKAGIKNDIRLLGPRDDIPAIMSALDIHVLSSVGEAFPNVLAESMACGTPCVTTDVGDAAFILGNTGWVVPSRNSKALAAAIAESIAAMGDTSAWQQRQAMARQRIIDNFSLEKMVAAYQKIWEGMPDSQDQKGMA
jgi:glycosyltransferase involved in cell wall biosynthesis